MKQNLKRSWKRGIAFVVVLIMLMSSAVFAQTADTVAVAEDTTIERTEVVLDAEDFLTDSSGSPINTFNGFGAVTCNNTSRLLLDYKEENPDAYWEIMKLMFDPVEGMGLSHIKVELGADVNTSSGTEPATKRSADEEANVLRGAGWHFAADAKIFNPDIKVEALRWGEPSWTGNDFNLRYQWYVDTIDAVYETFGYLIDYISPGQNEAEHIGNEVNSNGIITNTTGNLAWIKEFGTRIKSEKQKENGPDYSKIKIVAADTHSKGDATAWYIIQNNMTDVIDVFSYHYNIYGGANVERLNKDYGIEIWYSEGIAPLIRAEDRHNAGSEEGGVGGKRSITDIAQRFINMYNYSDSAVPARMTLWTFQPAISSNYDGADYSTKEILNADTPWSGYYSVDAGFQMVRHFTQFAESDWVYLEEGCYGNGVSDGDGGVNPDTSTDNYLTFYDLSDQNYTMVHANNTKDSRYYKLILKGMDTSKTVQLWETRNPDGKDEAYDANWFQNIGSVTPQVDEDGNYYINAEVKPYSLLTLTTLDSSVSESHVAGSNDNMDFDDDILALPYTDNFEYTEYALDDNGMTYLERRGGTPRYTTDQYGAFEVTEESGFGSNHVLTQIMNGDNRGYEWSVWSGGAFNNVSSTTPNTVLGDVRWTNYTAQIDFKLDGNTYQDASLVNFAGIGVRQVLHGGSDPSGYSARVDKEGNVTIYRKGSNTGMTAKISGFDASEWHVLALEAKENVITAYVDGEQIVSYTDNTGAPIMAGRIAILSGYYNTEYDNLAVNPIKGYAWSSVRLDDSSSRIEYSHINNGVNWYVSTSEGYAVQNRTLHTGNIRGTEIKVPHTYYTRTQGKEYKIYYKGEWQSGSSDAWATAASDGGLNYESAAYAELAFEGTGIEFYGNSQTAANSTAKIYLDGVFVKDVNFAQGGATALYSAEDLSQGQHTIRVVPSGSGWTSINSFVITNGEVESVPLNLAANSKVSASSEQNPSAYPVGNMIDGRIDNFWVSENPTGGVTEENSQYVLLEMDSIYKIDQLLIYGRTADVRIWIPKEFIISVSVDGMNYEEIEIIDGPEDNIWPYQEFHTVNFTAVRAKYVKIEIKQAWAKTANASEFLNPAENVQIAEIEIYESVEVRPTEVTLYHNTDAVTASSNPGNDPNRGQFDKIYFYRSDTDHYGWSSDNTNAWAQVTSSAGNSAFYEVVFEGTGIQLYGYIYDGNGIADIELFKIDRSDPLNDSGKIDEYSGTASFYDASVSWQNQYIGKAFEVKGLPYGYYKVRLTPQTDGGFSSCANVVILNEDEDLKPQTSETYFTIDFEGTGFYLNGNTSSAALGIYIDGEYYGTANASSATGNRDTSYWLSGLDYGAHKVEVYVLNGTFVLDGVNLVGPEYDGEIDKSALEMLVNSVSDLQEQDYTAGSWSVFKDALDYAADILYRSEASAQDVQRAYNALRNAYNSLEEVEPDETDETDETNETDCTDETTDTDETDIEQTDETNETEEPGDWISKEELKLLVDSAKEITQENYTDASWAVFLHAFEHAKSVLRETNSSGKMITEAYNNLEDAIKNLVEENSQTEDSGDTEDSSETRDTEETEDPSQTEETEDPRQTEETEETEDPEQTKETEETEDPEQTEQTEETEETKDPEQTEETEETEETEDPEQTEETEETEDPEQTEETEETEDPSQTEDTSDKAGGQSDSDDNNGSTGAGNGGKGALVKTGDSAEVMMILLIAIFSLMAVMFFAKRYKKIR